MQIVVYPLMIVEKKKKSSKMSRAPAVIIYTNACQEIQA